MLSSSNVLIPTDFDASIWASIVLGFVLIVPVLISHRHYRGFPEIKNRGGEETQTDCMVVIPARNEQGRIGQAVRGLPPDSVIVVDDFSSDGTAQEARDAGAGVIRARQLLSGELGKPNACMEGARVLNSRWILFADADTRYERGFLSAAVAAAEAGSIDFLSIYLKPEYRGWSESILSPYAVALYFFGINAGGDPAAAFNGQCVLVRRDPYEFVGGHRVLMTSVCDDVKMAAIAARHRLRFAVARAPRLGYVRIRPQDFERNARRFALVGFSKGAPIMLAAMAYLLWLPAVIWLLADGHVIAAAGYFFLPSVFLAPWYGWKRAILAPLGIYGMPPILIRSAVGAVTHRAIEWKGRII